MVWYLWYLWYTLFKNEMFTVSPLLYHVFVKRQKQVNQKVTILSDIQLFCEYCSGGHIFVELTVLEALEQHIALSSHQVCSYLYSLSK